MKFNNIMKENLIYTEDYVLLIDKKAEIKVGDYFHHTYEFHNPQEHYINKCSVVTTDMCTEQHPEGGVLGYIDNEENVVTEDYYCSKIIGYYPLNEFVKELDLPILPDLFEENTNKINSLAKNYFDEEHLKIQNENKELKMGYYVSDKLREAYIKNFTPIFVAGYKSAQSKQFSLEDMMKAWENGIDDVQGHSEFSGFDEFIQSLSTQQLPKEFIPEFETVYEDVLEGKEFVLRPCGKRLKTITNSKGKKELVGTYRL